MIDLTAAAGCFTRVSADAAADAGQGVGIAGKSVSLFKTAFGDQRHIPSCIRVSRTRRHTGEIGVEPIPVDQFAAESFLHDGIGPF
jgi:hypothetical protein